MLSDSGAFWDPKHSCWLYLVPQTQTTPPLYTDVPTPSLF